MCIVQYLPAVADEWIFETESRSLHSQWPSIEASSGPWVQALYSLSSPTPQILAMFCREVPKKHSHCILYSNMSSGFILQNVRRSNAGEESNWWKITKSKMFSWVVRKVHCLYPFFCVICMPADASQSLPAPAIQYLSSISLLSICASQKAIGRSFFIFPSF